MWDETEVGVNMKIYDIKLKIVKTILTIISIGLLSTSWIVVCDDYKNIWENSVEYTSDLIDEYGILYWAVQLIGMDTLEAAKNINDIEKMMEYISDGEFTAVEISEIIKETEALVQTINSMFGTDESYNANFHLFLWIYEVVFWAVIIQGVLMLYGIWFRGNASFEGGFYIAQISLFVSMCVICCVAYEWLQWWIIRPSLWALLAVACAIPTKYVKSIMQKLIANLKINIVHKSNNQKRCMSNNYSNIVSQDWKCKGCSTKNDSNAKFCVTCGKKKSEIIICKTCGMKMWDDEPCKICIQNSTKKLNVCSNCGGRIDEKSIFCQYCGKKIKET